MYYMWFKGLEQKIENLEREIDRLKNTPVVEKVEILPQGTNVTYNVLKNISQGDK